MPLEVVIFGQGYVGLPLAIEATKAGMLVHGIDIDFNKVEQIRSGISPVMDIANEEISSMISSQTYKVNENTDFKSSTNVICVCVPTPLDSFYKPDLTILKMALQNVAAGLKPGMLVIIESTIQPGATREFVLPLLESLSGLNRNQFLLAFSPERIDPANKIWNLKNTPKLVAGLTDSAALSAKEFYSQFIKDIEICSSLEVAETAKLLENSFRLVNISLINEVSFFCNKIGIEISDVINAASSKPYGFMAFHPSIGAGGHCIPIDPVYLSTKATELNSPINMIDLAHKINKSIPLRVVERAENLLGNLDGKKILIVGVAYKPNVSDTRETAAQDLISKLISKGAKVFWHDDLVGEWNGEKSSSLSDKYDLAIIVSLHDYLNLEALGKIPIINTRNSI